MVPMVGVETDLTPCLRERWLVVSTPPYRAESSCNSGKKRPPNRKHGCLRSSGMDVFVRVSTLLAFGLTPTGEMVWSRKSASSVALMVAFEGESF